MEGLQQQRLMGGEAVTKVHNDGGMMRNGSKWESTQMSTHSRIDKYIGAYSLNPLL